MGIFKSIKDNYKKSEAAVVVQNLLEEASRAFMFEGDAAKTANTLVAQAWEEFAVLLDGRNGFRPYKMSIAAISLARGISLHDADKMLSNSHAFAFCLGKILSEVDQNGGRYPLTALDMALLEKASDRFAEFAESTMKSEAGLEVAELLDEQVLTWDEWFKTYKAEVAKAIPSFQTEDGLSVIDLLDVEPLQRAHRDRVNPRRLARTHVEEQYSEPGFIFRVLAGKPST
ncbi:hypothetical protein ACVNHC_05455 [Pannonibacter sp. Q-1]